MKALVKSGNEVEWREVARRGILEPGEVEVEVEVAGICRTDLYAARGRIATADPVILGHEFAGRVVAVGSAVGDLEVGAPVTAAPLIYEENARGGGRGAPKMVGVDVDGAFAEYITLPRELLFSVPEGLPWRQAAYVEPVAASLAVVDAPIGPGDAGVILGGGRIGALTLRILQAHGFEGVRCVTLGEARDLAGESLDFVVETRATAEVFGEALRLLRCRGVLVLKSRPRAAVALDVLRAVRKELRLVGAHYGEFPRAIELLGRGLVVEDLLGPVHSPERFEEVFAALEGDESQKHFFGLRGR